MIKVAVIVRGGIIQETFVSGGNHNVELSIIDWDNIKAGQKELVIGETIEHVSAKRFNDMIDEANNAIKENIE